MYRGSKIIFVPDIFQSFFRFLFRIGIFFRRGTLQETHIRRQFQLAILTLGDTILIFIHDIGDLIEPRLRIGQPADTDEIAAAFIICREIVYRRANGFLQFLIYFFSTKLLIGERQSRVLQNIISFPFNEDTVVLQTIK